MAQFKDECKGHIERRTGEPSRKRLDYQEQVSRQLRTAAAAGRLERELARVGQRIIDLSGDLEAAKRALASEKLDIEGMAPDF